MRLLMVKQPTSKGERRGRKLDDEDGDTNGYDDDDDDAGNKMQMEIMRPVTFVYDKCSAKQCEFDLTNSQRLK